MIIINININILHIPDPLKHAHLLTCLLARLLQLSSKQTNFIFLFFPRLSCHRWSRKKKKKKKRMNDKLKNQKMSMFM